MPFKEFLMVLKSVGSGSLFRLSEFGGLSWGLGFSGCWFRRSIGDSGSGSTGSGLRARQVKLRGLRSHLIEDALSLRPELLLLQAAVPSWASLLSAIMVVTTASLSPNL